MHFCDQYYNCSDRIKIPFTSSKKRESKGHLATKYTYISTFTHTHTHTRTRTCTQTSTHTFSVCTVGPFGMFQSEV